MSDVTTNPEIYCNGRTYPEHSAWLNSLSPDDSLIVNAAVGWRYTLVVISYTKRMLAHELPTEFRLRCLEFLDGQSDIWPPEIIASIEPMCDAGAEIWREAQKLGASKALDKCGEWDVFSAFAALNPSLLDALRMRQNMRIYPRPGIELDQPNRSN